MYADVIVDIVHEKLDKIFQYKIPEHLEKEIGIGTNVSVPFGNGNRIIRGYVIQIGTVCNYYEEKIKEIEAVSKEQMPIEAKLICLAAWIKVHYGGTMIQALRTVLPIKEKERLQMQKEIFLACEKEEGALLLETLLKKNRKAQARVIAALLDSPMLKLDCGELMKNAKVTVQVIKTMAQKDMVYLEEEIFYRNPIKEKETAWSHTQVTYSKEQEEAIDRFVRDYKNRERKTYLIHGVTGSGKTEVYIQMIKEVIGNGQQAIVLIPEIALTYQTVARFQTHFGDRISVLHSRLSKGERYDQMMRAKEGQIDVMIGPRSALFTPFEHLGLIVIDEEHELTYKSEKVPRFHAVETAIMRANIEGASVVLGSATPSISSYYKAEHGEYTLLQIKDRVQSRKMPSVRIVDMRQELRSGNRSVLSEELKVLITDRLEKKQQIILFLNRRGYAGFISCRACGHIVKCPHCDISLSSHKNGKWICHYCGYEELEQKICIECGSPHIGKFKAGTQQVEEVVKREFPEANILRMDTDTTRKKDGHAQILSAFVKQEADILLGTQMIVKGHDIPNVTLVGILAADMSLYASDYGAGERTFQLLTQAAGRAGRGEQSGEVVIQTYSPENENILAAAKQDYKQFYEEELEFRELAGYPPVKSMLAVLIFCENEQFLAKAGHYLKEYLTRLDKKQEFVIIGPAQPRVEKIKDVYQKIMYIKHANYQKLIKAKDRLEEYIEINSGFSKVRVQFDFNPVGIG